MKPLSKAALCCGILFFSLACTKAGEEKYKMTDAQLSLTPEQARGRHIYNSRCLNCHESYTDQKRQSIPLVGLFSRPVLPSGTPANDERVADTITHGRRMMPATPLGDDDLRALLAYLHTL